jgi:hypothetical protein
MARSTSTTKDKVAGGEITGSDPQPDETSVNDDDTLKTPEENAKIVAKATNKSSTAKKDEPTDKAPTTGEVAGQLVLLRVRTLQVRA